MAFWPQTSSFSFERDFNKGNHLLKRGDNFMLERCFKSKRFGDFLFQRKLLLNLFNMESSIFSIKDSKFTSLFK